MSSSILTNMSAMTAVQNLAATQQSLANVQNQISTGLAISSASDNAAYFSIAQTMRTNVSDLTAVSSSLNLGSSVLATGTAATGQLTSILQTISADLTTAASNVGNSSTQSYLQTAISGLSNQLASIVNSASFNGVNLLNGSTSGSVSFVSGITGSGSNTQITSINVNTATTNLTGAGYTTGTNTAVDAYITASNQQAADQTTYNTDQATLVSALKAVPAADITAAEATQSPTLSSALKNIFGQDATVANGVITVGTTSGASGVNLIGSGGTYNLATGAYAASSTATAGDLAVLGGKSATGSTANQTVTPATGATTGDIYATAEANAQVQASPAASKIVNGALFQVGQINLTSSTTASQIQSYIQQVGTALTAVNTASENLGSASSQMTLQSTYISSLSNSLTSGVGTLVDADMNEASTRLSALQTQQQLGVQALSVANQNSQLILKLFQ